MVLRQIPTDIIDFARYTCSYFLIPRTISCSLLELHVTTKTTIFENEIYTKQRHKEQNN